MLDVVNPRVGTDFDELEARIMIEPASICTSASPSARPPMASVVRMLEGEAVVAELTSCHGDMTTTNWVDFSGDGDNNETESLTQTWGTTDEVGHTFFYPCGTFLRNKWSFFLRA